MAQLARALAEISRSAGSWILSGADTAASLNNVIPANNVTFAITPALIGTQSFEVSLGPNWNGAALARPNRNTDCMITTYYYVSSGNVTVTVELMEGATVRDTWNIGVISNTVPLIRRREVPSAAIDAITDFTNLRLRTTYITASNNAACAYLSFVMPDVNGSQLGSYTADFSTLGSIPRCFELQVTNLFVNNSPILSNGYLWINAGAGAVARLVCYALDLPADHWSEVTCAPGFKTADIGIGGSVRLDKDWVTSGTDNSLYDLVSLPPTGPHYLKVDGVSPSVILVSVPYATVPALVAGDTFQTRMVGTVVSGRKNGIEIASFNDAARPAFVDGYPGLVISNFTGVTPWPAISFFRMSSVIPAGGSRTITKNTISTKYPVKYPVL